jgi:FkbM family methyltransferase
MLFLPRPIRFTLHDVAASGLRAFRGMRGRLQAGRLIARLLVRPGERRVLRVRLRNGTLLYVDPATDLQETIFWTGEYDAKIIARMERLLEPNAVVLDVGANIGAYTIQLGRRLRGNGRLIAIEPVPANVQRLRQNIEANGLTGMVDVVNVAVADHDGIVHLRGAKGSEGRAGNAVVADSGVAASVTTLDSVVETRGILRCDLIKLDIEGCEFSALRGAVRLLRRCKPVLYLELNAHWMRHFGWTVRDLHAYLAPLGYELFNDAGERLKAGYEAEGVASAWAHPGERTVPLKR